MQPKIILSTEILSRSLKQRRDHYQTFLRLTHFSLDKQYALAVSRKYHHKHNVKITMKISLCLASHHEGYLKIGLKQPS